MAKRNEHPSTMYRQGNGWIVSSWSEHYNCYVLSHEMPYWQARAAVGSDNCIRKNCTCQSHNHNA